MTKSKITPADVVKDNIATPKPDGHNCDFIVAIDNGEHVKISLALLAISQLANEYMQHLAQDAKKMNKRKTILSGSLIAVASALSGYGIYKYLHRKVRKDESQKNEAHKK